MAFQKDLSYIGWDEVKRRQQVRFALAEEWIALTQMGEGSRVIDIGPGPGIFVRRYLQSVGETGCVWAIEKSSEAIACLKSELEEAERERLDIRCADAEQTVEPLGEADIILVTDVLHHATSPSALLRTVYRLASSASTVLVAEFDPEAPGEIGPPLPNRLSQQVVSALSSEAGFQITAAGKQQYEHYYLLLQKR